jgi:hypothetical protein
MVCPEKNRRRSGPTSIARFASRAAPPPDSADATPTSAENPLLEAEGSVMP